MDQGAAGLVRANVAPASAVARPFSVNSRFHDAIAVASGRPMLTDVIRQVRLRSDRNTVDIPGRPAPSLLEHETLVPALEQGNGLRTNRMAALRADEPTDAHRQRITERSGEA